MIREFLLFVEACIIDDFYKIHVLTWNKHKPIYMYQNKLCLCLWK